MEDLILQLKELLPLLIPLIIIQFALMLVALVDCLKNNRTNGPQWVWIIVIVFVNIIGPIIYFVFGRRNND